MKKRLLSTLLVLCMVLTLLPTAWAADATSGSCGDYATWSFNASTGTLTISGTGAMDDYYYDWGQKPTPWMSYNDQITSVVVSPGITHIGHEAFGSVWNMGVLSNLKTVSLPSTLTSIGEYAFAYSGLTSVTLPQSLQTICFGAFDGTSLTTLHIPASVTSIGYNRSTGKEAHDVGGIETLTSITVDAENQNYCTVDGVLYDKNMTKLIWYPGGKTTENYTIPSSISETLYIDEFWGIRSLRSITVPNGVTLAERGTTPPDGVYDDDSWTFVIYFAGEFPQNIDEWIYLSYDGGLVNIEARKLENSRIAKIMGLSPVNGAADVGYDASNPPVFRITFDREIASGSQEYVANVDLNSPGAFSIYRAPDNQLIYKPSQYASFDFVLNLEKNRLTITPVNNHTLLDPSTEYYVTMGEGFVNFADGSTNQAINKGDWVFTTANEDNLSFTYASSVNGDSTYSGLSYRDDWFFASSSTYRHNLAKLSLALAMSGFGSNVKSMKDANVKNFLYDMDFDNSKYISYGYDSEDNNTVAMAISQKEIFSETGNKATLLAICLRGGGYGNGGWSGNMTVGDSDPYHEGFYKAAIDAKNKIENYLSTYGIDKNTVRIWITGFSRSAAVANLLSAQLRVNNLCKSENLYTYTFATPNNQIILFEVPYNNIFNIINPNDIVPTVPLAKWEFGKMGTSYFLPSMVQGHISTKYFDGIRKNFNSITGGAAQYWTPANTSPTLAWLSYTAGNALPSRKSYATYLETPLRNFLNGDKSAFDDFLLGVTTTEEILQLLDESKYPTLALKIYDVIQKTPDDSPVMLLLSAAWDVVKGAASEYTSSKGTDLVNIGICTAFKDLVEHGTSSTLLKEHWPEVYFAWMTEIDKNDLTQTKQFVSKTAILRCPIDVSIYDEHGILVAQVIDDEVQEIDNSTVSVAVVGESDKVFVLPNDKEYRIEINATDSGTMNYTIIENAADGTALRTVEFYGIPIENEDELTANLNNIQFTNSDNYVLTKNKKDKIYPDIESSVTPVQPVFVNPTNDKLEVDGKPQTPAAYKINDYNYFKLRDIAALLNGTGKQFSVGYESSTGEVSLTSGQPYEVTDADLTALPAESRQATISTNVIYINGVRTQLTIYKIDGYNYFKLRDLASALDFYVGWTADRGMFLESDKPYSA